MLKHPEAINLPDLQIWNNAIFDNGSSTNDQTAAIKPSCCPLQPISLNGSETFLKLNSCKENNTTSLCKSPVLTKSPLPIIKPLHPNGATEVSQPKPIKLLFKQGLLALSTNSETETEIEREPINDDRKIDTQIEEIEAEISRLSSKLESLRVEKAEEEQKLKNPVASEKFEKTPSGTKIRQRRVTMGQSEILGIRSGKPEKTPFPSALKSEKTPFSTSKTTRQRGLSLGPSEIVGIKSQYTGKTAKTPISTQKIEKTPSSSASKTIRQRGVSMGPSEIMGIKSQYSGKTEKTPIQSTLNRRKFCFLKLPEIEEENSKQKGGRSSSLSPKSRLSVSKIPLRQGFTTIGSKKTEKKSNGVLSSIQPKKLFKEEEKSVSAKKPIKPGRVVASRYNQTPVPPAGNPKQTELRRSLPGTNKDSNNSKGFLKKRASLAGPCYDLGSSRNQINESRAKMVSEIRNEEALCDKHLEDFLPPLLNNDDVLPRIRNLKCKNESPRDSGPAKKVAELIGRKSYFGAEEIDVSTSVCQALSFDEEEDHE